MNKCDCVTPDVSKDKCGNVKKNSHAPCTMIVQYSVAPPCPWYTFVE